MIHVKIVNFSLARLAPARLTNFNFTRFNCFRITDNCAKLTGTMPRRLGGSFLGILFPPFAVGREAFSAIIFIPAAMSLTVFLRIFGDIAPLCCALLLRRRGVAKARGLA